MKLIISNISGIPIYQQIKEQIKNAIISKNLKENEMLPSLRKLSKDLRISVLTITRAYTELEQEGFVKNVQGKGCYVLESGSDLVKEQLLLEIEEHILKAISLAKRENITKQDLHKIINQLEGD